jgi:transmembrane sensor
MVKTSHAQVTREATEWLAAIDSGTADLAGLERWKAADPRHSSAFAEAVYAWEALDRLRSTRSEQPVAARAITRRTALRMAAAAGVVGIAGVSGFPFANAASAETGIGERRRVTLPDGTQVELNTRTRVRWPRLVGQRTLWLEHGEVALDVAPGATPFRLVADKAVSLDSGQYNVRREEEVLTLLPLRGQATVGGTPIKVGDIGAITQGTATVAAADANARERALGWQRGDIIFDGETIAAAAAEYNRYLARPIVLVHPTLARQRLGGRFRSNDPLPFLQALADGFGARVVDTGEGPIIVSIREKKRGDR